MYHTIWYELHGRYYRWSVANNPRAISAKKSELREAGAIILPGGLCKFAGLVI